MKVLSLQPCSIYENGGMGRLLRRIYEGHEEDVIGLWIIGNTKSQKFDKIKEIIIPAFPLHRSWMRWKVRNLFAFLREVLFRDLTKKRLVTAAKNIKFDILHVINHGSYSTSLCSGLILDNKKLWTSFHDHFSTTGSSFQDTKLLWSRSDRRLVISNELGVEYQRLFGFQKYELITDGLFRSEISAPIKSKSNKTNFYFAGLVHLEYYPLFSVLADALDSLTSDGHSFELILRGTRPLKVLQKRKFTVTYKSNFISDNEIKTEMDLAEILYLPIKFDIPEFYLYSLSTKMVGYLGAAGKILYHGPGDSAACQLLKKNNAAFLCNTLDETDMRNTILSLLKSDMTIKENSELLAKNSFDINTMNRNFWQV